MTHGKVRIAAAAAGCAGITVTSVGIALGLTYGGPAYLVVITTGSVLVAAGALLWLWARL